MIYVEEFADNGPALVVPLVYKDERGYFVESFNEKEFSEKLGEIHFVQDNESLSASGVIRGLHFQKPPYEQAKLVRVIKGAAYDIAVDLRKGSPTYGEYFSIYLSEGSNKQFFIPRGFAHGFVAIKDDTLFQYKCDNFYNKESEGCILYNDPTINIPWENWIHKSQQIVSSKDKNGVLFKNFESPFIY